MLLYISHCVYSVRSLNSLHVFMFLLLHLLIFGGSVPHVVTPRIFELFENMCSFHLWLLVTIIIYLLCIWMSTYKLINYSLSNSCSKKNFGVVLPGGWSPCIIKPEGLRWLCAGNFFYGSTVSKKFVTNINTIFNFTLIITQTLVLHI